MPVKETFKERGDTTEEPRISKTRSAAGAIEASRLTDEELFFLITFADRLGYDRAIRAISNALFPLRNFRRWFVYFGGWEPADLSVWEGRRKPGLDLWYDDRLRDPFPLSFFGSRLTFFGGWWQLKTRFGWLVKTPNGVEGGRRETALYLSPDGTPQHPDAVVLLRRRPRELSKS